MNHHTGRPRSPAHIAVSVNLGRSLRRRVDRARDGAAFTQFARDALRRLWGLSPLPDLDAAPTDRRTRRYRGGTYATVKLTESEVARLRRAPNRSEVIRKALWARVRDVSP